MILKDACPSHRTNVAGPGGYKAGSNTTAPLSPATSGAHSRIYRSERNWIEAETEREVRRHLLGDEAAITFADAVLLYEAKPAEARYLIKILPTLGPTLLMHITPQMVLDLGAQIYPDEWVSFSNDMMITLAKIVLQAAAQPEARL